MAWNSKLHGTVGTYCSVALTIPRHLNFHRFDQIKVACDKILPTFIESVEIKVARYQIGGNLSGVVQQAPRNSRHLLLGGMGGGAC